MSHYKTYLVRTWNDKQQVIRTDHIKARTASKALRLVELSLRWMRVDFHEITSDLEEA